jgi:H2-forming N5,N10-methylenetetrahydromethanopterin dehydrogenase-like enzyme
VTLGLSGDDYSSAAENSFLNLVEKQLPVRLETIAVKRNEKGISTLKGEHDPEKLKRKCQSVHSRTKMSIIGDPKTVDMGCD